MTIRGAAARTHSSVRRTPCERETSDTMPTPSETPPRPGPASGAATRAHLPLYRLGASPLPSLPQVALRHLSRLSAPLPSQEGLEIARDQPRSAEVRRALPGEDAAAARGCRGEEIDRCRARPVPPPPPPPQPRAWKGPTSFAPNSLAPSPPEQSLQVEPTLHARRRSGTKTPSSRSWRT